MSGHNKWSKIKHRKAATDAQKSKSFTRIVRLLSVEAKKAKGDINSPGLKTAIEKARSENMPKDNIDRAIKKGMGDDDTKLQSITYEAYGPGGCALVIEVLTDNRNKSAAEIKHLLSKHGLSLAGIGAATWAFEKQISGWIPKIPAQISENDGVKLQELLDNLEENEDVQEVFTNAE